MKEKWPILYFSEFVFIKLSYPKYSLLDSGTQSLIRKKCFNLLLGLWIFLSSFSLSKTQTHTEGHHFLISFLNIVQLFSRHISFGSTVHCPTIISLPPGYTSILLLWRVYHPAALVCRFHSLIRFLSIKITGSLSPVVNFITIGELPVILSNPPICLTFVTGDFPSLNDLSLPVSCPDQFPTPLIILPNSLSQASNSWLLLSPLYFLYSPSSSMFLSDSIFIIYELYLFL